MDLFAAVDALQLAPPAALSAALAGTLPAAASIGLAFGVPLALAAALALVLVAARSAPPATWPLATAAALVALCLAMLVVAPVRVPPVAGVVVALLAGALATIGGNPAVRWVLAVTEQREVAQGAGGEAAHGVDDGNDEIHSADDGGDEILRGGATIGYLERFGAALGIIAGFPLAIAMIVALKGVGRFTELSTAAARERFIVGTLASLVWAAAVAGVAVLAIT